MVWMAMAAAFPARQRLAGVATSHPAVCFQRMEALLPGLGTDNSKAWNSCFQAPELNAWGRMCPRQTIILLFVF